MKRILVVDDDDAVQRTLERQLRSLGREVVQALDAEHALRLLDEQTVDLVLTDVRMPGPDGMELCRRIQSGWPELPVLIMTGFGTLDAAIQAIRAGAWDFLRKPFGVGELELALDRAKRDRSMRAELTRLRRVTRGERGPAGLVGASPPMQELFDRIERAGPSQVNVLILGPSGAGKERVARGLHQASPRAGRPFVAVNCAALPENLVESELFGHAEGAFTGAERARAGLFRAADGGTLFLDEVGELTLPAQARMLRAIEERRIRPVGQEQEIPVDVRLVAATNVDLRAAVEEKRFREDLYYRLRVVTMVVPPLAERGEDVLLLAAEFLDAIQERTGTSLSWDGRFEAALLRWSWPGNVRELRNALEGAAALAPDGVLLPEHLPAELRAGDAPSLSEEGRALALPPLAEVERRHVLKVLRATEGNRSKAARILGIDRKTLLARLKRYGMQE